jgi:hypothetical protein
VSKIRVMTVLFAVLIASLTAAAASASAMTLVGNTSVQPGTDSIDGPAEAFPFTSSGSGTAVKAAVYVDSGSAATGLVVGLYSDSGGAPGTLLGQASLSSPSSAAWNMLSFTPVSISANTPYWLAILGTGGQLHFRDDGTAGGCRSVTSTVASVTPMPSSFSTASWWDTCNVSAYLFNSDSASVSNSAPVSDAAPTVSGDFSFHGSGQGGYGGTVSATVGTWTSSGLTTYSFQWQECDSSGGNCSNVSPTGMIPDAYIITPGEVGNTIRVAVTATNSYGSTTAYSAASPVIILS